MKIENWPLKRIKPYKKNAKKHQIGWIEKSIKEFKIDQPIVVDENGIILKGHGRLEAAKGLKLKTFPVFIKKGLTEEQKKLCRIADNRTGEGGWDNELLTIELKEIIDELPDFNLEELGINQKWFDELDIDFNEAQDYDDSKDDEVPEIDEENVICKEGDLWQLGKWVYCEKCKKKHYIT